MSQVDSGVLRLRFKTKLLFAFALLVYGKSLQASSEPQLDVISLSATGHDRLYDIAFTETGSSYAVGSLSDGTAASSDAKVLIVKHRDDGSIDTSFGQGGSLIFNLIAAGDGEVARSIAVDSKGRIVVAGSVEHAGGADARDRDLFVLRLTAAGQIDSSFGTAGVAILNLSEGETVGTGYISDGFGGMIVDAQDRVLVHGSAKRPGGLDSDFVMVRLDSEGDFDATFGDTGRATLDIRNLSASPKAPVLLPDGDVIGTGYMREGAIVLPVVYKLTSEGRLDTSYGKGGIFSEAVLNSTTEVYSAVLQGDSLITVGYGRDNEQESLDVLSLRINPEGKLDTSFGTQGFARIDVDGFNDNGRNIALLPDGRILLVGGGRFTSTNSDGMLAILKSNGELDESFGDSGVQLFDFGGAQDFLWGADVAPDLDKVMAVGIKGVQGATGDDSAIVTLPL